MLDNNLQILPVGFSTLKDNMWLIPPGERTKISVIVQTHYTPTLLFVDPLVSEYFTIDKFYVGNLPQRFEHIGNNAYKISSIEAQTGQTITVIPKNTSTEAMPFVSGTLGYTREVVALPPTFENLLLVNDFPIRFEDSIPIAPGATFTSCVAVQNIFLPKEFIPNQDAVDRVQISDIRIGCLTSSVAYSDFPASMFKNEYAKFNLQIAQQGMLISISGQNRSDITVVFSGDLIGQALVPSNFNLQEYKNEFLPAFKPVLPQTKTGTGSLYYRVNREDEWTKALDNIAIVKATQDAIRTGHIVETEYRSSILVKKPVIIRC